MITVQGLSKHFGACKAVDRVSFNLRQGERVVLAGPSGSGKTTLLRLIAGLERPDEGKIHLDGKLASQPGWVLPPHQRQMGFVFQTPALWPHLTVAQNIAFGISGLPKQQLRQRLETILEEVGLQHLAKRHPAQLSGGEARRVALGRTLAPRPRILLCDEPLTNLDLENKTHLLALIMQAVDASEASLIYVTHDPGEARKVAAPVWEMEQGCLRIEKPGTGTDEPASGDCAP
ncbi:MAG: ABC transporter ATP-binding protein [Anaerolineales bacterium]|nr:ABC transporter ATP-binding protein [Anaerolineales bacterium]